MFIETEDRGFINVLLCRRITRTPLEPGVYTFIFSEDHWVDATPCSEADIERLTHPKPIPASNGFFHLKYHGDVEEGLFDSTPIIGWKGEFEFGANPMTIEGDHTFGGETNGRNRAIKLPDGRVLDQYDELLYSSADEWARSRFEDIAKFEAIKKAA